MRRYSQITARFLDEDVEWLCAEAHSCKRTVSEQIRHIVVAYKKTLRISGQKGEGSPQQRAETNKAGRL
jgi:hypothetical protein